MNVSFAQTLDQERDRLSRLFADCLAQQCDANPESIWLAISDLRQTIEDVLRRRVEELSKEELIALQSALQSALDEQDRQTVQQWSDRRLKA